MFTGAAKDMTFVKVGYLVFAESEWNAVRDQLHSACEFIPDEIPEPVSR
jgi:hypothetical protein